jgi:hypothetical protein
MAPPARGARLLTVARALTLCALALGAHAAVSPAPSVPRSAGRPFLSGLFGGGAAATAGTPPPAQPRPLLAALQSAVSGARTATSPPPAAAGAAAQPPPPPLPARLLNLVFPAKAAATPAGALRA